MILSGVAGLDSVRGVGGFTTQARPPLKRVVTRHGSDGTMTSTSRDRRT
jgi:hypothetical protein